MLKVFVYKQLINSKNTYGLNRNYKKILKLNFFFHYT